MSGACFTPTSLRIAPGGAVTFVNRDPMTHNVGGIGWGDLEDMVEGDAFTATFADPGVYPYACSYHPGMTGAIVVGDGTGAGNGTAVTVEPFVAAPASFDTVDDAAAVAADPPSPSSSGWSGWVAAGAAGLLLGLGAGAFGRWRTKVGPTPP
jgi:hypothetical protein